jgi:hypothetical protein
VARGPEGEAERGWGAWVLARVLETRAGVAWLGSFDLGNVLFAAHAFPPILPLALPRVTKIAAA